MGHSQFFFFFCLLFRVHKRSTKVANDQIRNSVHWCWKSTIAEQKLDYILLLFPIGYHITELQLFPSRYQLQLDRASARQQRQHQGFSFHIFNQNLGLSYLKGRGGGTAVSVLTSPLTIRVRIPLTPLFFSVKLCLKRKKINKKEAGVGPLF